jgi:hypothetical protein
MVLYAYMCCVCVFLLHQESLNMILGGKPLIFEVVLLQQWAPQHQSSVTTRSHSSDGHNDVRRPSLLHTTVAMSA